MRSWGSPPEPRNDALVADTSLDLSLGLPMGMPMHPLRHEAPSAQRTVRRWTAWAVVAALHGVFLSIFMISQTLPQLFRHPGSETLILLPQAAGNSNSPSVPTIVPPMPDHGAQEVMPAPITIMPPPVIQITPERSGPTPGDILGAVGQEIGCGANSFENLTPAEQARCRRIPWHGVMLPNGSVVLDTPELASRFKPPPEPKISGADAQRQEMDRAPDCPLILNLPCMNSFVHH